jgi:hypothetical protein
VTINLSTSLNREFLSIRYQKKSLLEFLSFVVSNLFNTNQLLSSFSDVEKMNVYSSKQEMKVLKLKIVDFRSQLRSCRIIKTPKSFDWPPTPMPKTEEKETNVDEKQEFFQKAQDGFSILF